MIMVPYSLSIQEELKAKLVLTKRFPAVLYCQQFCGKGASMQDPNDAKHKRCLQGCPQQITPVCQ